MALVFTLAASADPLNQQVTRKPVWIVEKRRL
jgi:hypothetical protein